VIERPASVVKELIENALDAGATQVDVEIEEAGAGLIRVVDNGAGMTPDDLAFSVLRHATSKIAHLDDLSTLITFGFRGEALASVAAVSHLEIISRHREHDAAALMFWEGGTRTEEREIGAAIGTAVTVRHLFFNTPARREFMRAAATETKHVIETVTDFACVLPAVGFSLSIDGRPTIRVAPAPAMRDRLADLFGANLTAMLLAFSGGDAELTVRGFAGKPELSRANRDRILTYVNNRRVTALSLAHAATAAYGETIPRGRFPFAIVCVDINPHKVDVNVHPTKREVRFTRDRSVYDLTYYTINKTIFASPQTAPVMHVKVPEADAQAKSAWLPFGTAPSAGLPAGGPAPVSPASIRPAGADRGEPAGASSPVEHEGVDVSEPHTEGSGEPSFRTSAPPVADGVSNLWQFRDLYIVAEVGDELWVIDQHTAHERVLYEEILIRAQKRAPETQRLLFPESIDLAAGEWQLCESAGEILASLGFEVRPFGERTVLLEGVPTGLRIRNPVLLFRRVIEDIEIAQRAGADLMKAAAASTACRSSVMAGDRLKLEEMQTLFARLMHTENPFSCPHGRPTMVKIPIADFDRKFCRA
jgi:DNA mismatch repair protein MutL